MSLIKTPDGAFYLDDSEFQIDYNENTVRLVGDAPAPGGDFVPVSGGTMTGPLILSREPLEEHEAATKQYVDEVSQTLNHVSDTVDEILEGTEFLPYLPDDYQPPVATPESAGVVKIGAGINVTDDGTISASDQGGLTQVEADERYAQLSGSTFEGSLNMGNNQIKGMANATEDTDGVTKGQMDAAISSAVPTAMLNSLPNQFMEGIYNVTRTATTNTAEIRLYKKQSDGTYSSSEEHGVITLIAAGHGPDDIDGAGLMTYADKQKLDAIPAPSAANNGKILVVENGAYTFKTLAELQGV